MKCPYTHVLIPYTSHKPNDLMSPFCLAFGVTIFFGVFYIHHIFYDFNRPFEFRGFLTQKMPF